MPNTCDFIKSMIIVAISTFITGLYQLIAGGGAVKWLTIKPMVIVLASYAISYLTKNLLSNSKSDFLKAETI